MAHRRMSSSVLSALTLLVCALNFTAAQTSCRGRCGAEYYRGYMCQCDFTCLSYGECCSDFEGQCTTKDSCKGRCGEGFKRGRLCDCDEHCVKFNHCCSDYKSQCDVEEKISGADGDTAPGKTSSCHNVNNIKPTDPALNEATEQDIAYEGDSADDGLFPAVGPTSFPQDDFNDDTYDQFLPDDGFSDHGVDHPEVNPTPESTSASGSSTADLVDEVPTDPTQLADTVEITTETVAAASQTETTPPDGEPTQAADITTNDEELSTTSPDDGDPASSGATPPQPTTAAVSIQPTPPSRPQRGDSPDSYDPEVPPEADNTDLTVASTGAPEVTTVPASNPTVDSVSTGPTQESLLLQEISQVTTEPLSTPDSTSIPDATTSDLKPDAANTEEVTTGPPTTTAEPADPSTQPESLTNQTPKPTDAVQDDTSDVVTPEGPVSDPADATQEPTNPVPVEPSNTTPEPTKLLPAEPSNATPEPTKPTPAETTSKPQDQPDLFKPIAVKPVVARPSSKPQTKPLDVAQTLNVYNPREYQGDDSNDTNLCSGRPVSGVTTLRNGTIVVFRGHFFWFLDRHREPGPARDITQVWGVPSPIDTVFTRCNCQGKTYILKGLQYWRFENDVLDPGFPKIIKTGFDGLRGHITAALSVPQYRRRAESVYFFKRGGTVQKYSYQSGTSPTCNKKPQYPIITVSNRVVRQAVSALGPSMNIRTSWRGFPSTITAAVSIPTRREPEGFKYYVFSRTKSYSVRMDGERPAIAAPAANTSPQSNSVFRCPKKV